MKVAKQIYDQALYLLPQDTKIFIVYWSRGSQIKDHRCI